MSFCSGHNIFCNLFCQFCIMSNVERGPTPLRCAFYFFTQAISQKLSSSVPGATGVNTGGSGLTETVSPVALFPACAELAIV